MQREMIRTTGLSGEDALEKLKRRFEEWRRSRERRGPIPGELLKAAKGLVGHYRPAPVAKALGLHYWHVGRAKSNSEETGVKRRRPKRREGLVSVRSVASFVKVPLEAPLPSPSLEMEGPGVVEFENPLGYKARVYLGRAPSKLVSDLLKAIGGERR